MATKPTVKKGELTRGDLLAAARSVFGRVGYSGAEIGLIAREAGKSIGVFYIYFANKDELLATLVDEFRVELQQTLTSPLNPPEEVGTILTTLWRTYKNHAATFVALTEAAVTIPKFTEMSQALRDYARNDFQHMILERQRLGFCSGVNPIFASEALETMVNYCLYDWLARGTSQFKDAAEEETALTTLVKVIRATLQMD